MTFATPTLRTTVRAEGVTFAFSTIGLHTPVWAEGTTVAFSTIGLPTVMLTESAPIAFHTPVLSTTMRTERVRITFSTGVLVATMRASLLPAYHWHGYGARGHRHCGMKARMGECTSGLVSSMGPRVSASAERTNTI